MPRRPPPLAPPHPTKQARSRQTLDRLLRAAEEVRARAGLEGATGPTIARRAGVSVGIVYRRFPDKDALLRAVYERFFARSRESNRAALAPDKWAGVPLPKMVRAVIGGMVRGYEQHRALLRALFRYAETHPDPEFRRRADELSSEAFALLGDLLLASRGRIRHPDPPAAIRFALLAVALTLQGLLLPEHRAHHPYAASAATLAEELSRLVLGYLGAGR